MNPLWGDVTTEGSPNLLERYHLLMKIQDRESGFLYSGSDQEALGGGVEALPCCEGV